MLWVVPLERLVDGERAVEVLLVPPPRDAERRHRERLRQVGHDRLARPERVVVRMRDEVVPRRQLAVEVARVHGRQRPEPQVPVVRVVRVEGELRVLLGRLHHRRVLEAVAEPEGTVVVEVVAEPHVGGTRLGARGLERRVRVEQRHRGRPPAVRYAEDPDAAVGVGHVLHEPVDGVVGVGGLVDRAADVPVARRALHDELPLTPEAPAQVLGGDHIAVGRQFVQRPAGRDRADHLGPHAVGRAVEQDRQRPVRAFRDEDLGVEPDAVAHRDHRRVADVPAVQRGRGRRELGAGATRRPGEARPERDPGDDPEAERPAGERARGGGAGGERMTEHGHAE